MIRPEQQDTPPVGWMTTGELAYLLGVTRNCVTRWVQLGRLPANRVGKQYRFERRAVDKWLKASTFPPFPAQKSTPRMNDGQGEPEEKTNHQEHGCPGGEKE